MKTGSFVLALLLAAQMAYGQCADPNNCPKACLRGDNACYTPNPGWPSPGVTPCADANYPLATVGAVATPACLVCPTALPSGLPADWSSTASNLVALYYMEEAAGATRANSATGADTCGSACALSDNNTVGQSATAMQGTYAAQLTAGASNAPTLSCALSTCGAINFAGGSSFSVLAWVYPTADNGNGNEVFSSNDTYATDGYSMELADAGSSLMYGTCRLYGASGGTDIGAGRASANKWYHLGCTQKNGGAWSGFGYGTVGQGDGRTYTQSSATTARVGRAASTASLTGNVDELSIWSMAMNAASICRILRCGINGSHCRCDTGTPANWKACTADADCGAGNICADGGHCYGRDDGFCAGGTNINLHCNLTTAGTDCPSSSCTVCSPASLACNATGPTAQ